MFGIGMMEFVVVAVAILVFVGPQKMPELMRQAGRFFVHMRRTATEVRSTFDGVVQEAEAEIRREEFDKIKKVMDETRQSIEAPLQTQEYHGDHHHDQPHHDDPHLQHGTDETPVETNDNPDPEQPMETNPKLPTES
jgi:sec-independent protein translocase protein TatB